MLAQRLSKSFVAVWSGDARGLGSTTISCATDCGLCGAAAAARPPSHRARAPGEVERNLKLRAAFASLSGTQDGRRTMDQDSTALGPTPEGLLDVLVVGGGPAGLSAALVLGRCRRSVLLCDSGE